MKSDTTPFYAGLAIYEVSRMIRRDFDRQARALGFNTGQWRALWHLSRNPGVTQATLADILEMQPISLTTVLDKLEAAGLMERRPHPTDGRAVQLFLTDAAKMALEQLWAIGERTSELAMSGVSEAEHKQLIGLLGRMKTNLSVPEQQEEKMRSTAAAGRRK